ncbi:alpha-E domain-containing protein [Candidatus Pelagibacter bacterium nBUS_25]|uniref:alpha-E domain-containing protein n=1 Tax=Candidatus Pelagibacter bacterium nBUS_25 TaxID=3374187 RepID=UPI003EB9CFA8
MLSRRAKLIFWMSRYLERSNFTSRLLITTCELQLDLSLENEISWKPLLTAMSLNKDYLKLNKKYSEKKIIEFFISNKENNSSIINSLNYSKENSLIVRDILPEQSILKLNELLIKFNKTINRKNSNKKNLKLLSNIIQGSQNFMYSTDLEMQRNIDYQFLGLGRFIERTDMLIRILQSQTLRSKQHKKGYEYLTLEWINILKSISAFQAYRQHSKKDISILDIIEFFLKTKIFPRSINWNLNQIERAIFRISKKNDLKKNIKEIQRDVNNFKIKSDDLDNFLLFLEKIQKKIVNLDNLVQKKYFS